MAGGRPLRDLHRKVVKIEPALIKPQCGCEPLRRQSVGHVERSDPKPYRGGWKAQQRWSEFGVRPARSRPGRLGRPKRERQKAPERHAVDRQLALDLRLRRSLRRRDCSPGVERLLGVGDLRARLRHGL